MNTSQKVYAKIWTTLGPDNPRLNSYELSQAGFKYDEALKSWYFDVVGSMRVEQVADTLGSMEAKGMRVYTVEFESDEGVSFNMFEESQAEEIIDPTAALPKMDQIWYGVQTLKQ